MVCSSCHLTGTTIVVEQISHRDVLIRRDFKACLRLLNIEVFLHKIGLDNQSPNIFFI
jgi:hypothetical protein